jgi:hypothetical protein
MVRFSIQVTLLIAVLIAAWRSGGKPERHVATIYATMLVIGTLVEVLSGPPEQADYEQLHLARFLLDASALLAVIRVALCYDRWWTLWVGSAQFIAVMAHLLRALEMPIPALAYAVMERWPVWIAILLTGLGTYLHHRRHQATVKSTSQGSLSRSMIDPNC